VTGEGGRLKPRARVGLAAEIVWSYAVAWRALRKHGLRHAMATARDRFGVRDGVTQMSVEQGIRLGRAVRRTLNVLPSDSRCLMQALVLSSLLARRGVDSTVVIGVRPGEKFGAHAWVELAGHPILPGGNGDFGRLVEL
jgi:hypothetical protein